jgi:hypothetical protein
MEPFESIGSMKGVLMVRLENSPRSDQATNSRLLICMVGAVVIAAIGPMRASAAGFDEQFGSGRAATLSIGDRSNEELVKPVAEWDALVSLPGIPSAAEPVFVSEEPPADAGVATISDFEASFASSGPMPCPAGQACSCGRCDTRHVAHDGLIQRIHERNERFTTKFRTEAILLFRGPPASRPLFTSYNEVSTTTGPTVFNANQLASDPLAAPRLVLQRLDECGHGFEGAVLYAGNFYGYKELPFVPNGYAFAPPGIYGNTWGVNNTPLSASQSTLVANLYSAEVNLRSRRGFGATSFLAGFRWLQWGENWVLSDQFSDPADPSVVGIDSFRTNCINNLYGGQIGLDTLLWNRGEGFRVESLVKAGAYYNAAAQSSSYDYATSTGFSFSRQVGVPGPGSCSFVGEVGLTAVMPLSRNIDFRCGYFGLWLEGIAQPLNQLSGQTLTQIDAPAGTLDTSGTVVVQGLSLALEGRW